MTGSIESTSVRLGWCVSVVATDVARPGRVPNAVQQPCHESSWRHGTTEGPRDLD
jgi:hypothetical protein